MPTWLITILEAIGLINRKQRETAESNQEAIDKKLKKTEGEPSTDK